MRVGLVGCGRWGVHILRDLLSLGCEVPVVARSGASVERARAGSATLVLPSIDALEEAGVDGVVVATQTTAHLETVEEALGLGVPVYVEKPLCTDPGEADRLADLGGDRLFVMDKWRYHPGVLRLAELGRAGALGEVQLLKTTRVGWGNPHPDVDCVWILAPHDLAIGLEILGRLPPPSAAVAQTEGGRPVSLVGLLEDDRSAHVLDVSERSPARTRRVELHCEGGVAVLGDGWDEHVSLYRRRDGGAPVEERLATPGELPLLAELRAFVEHLAGGPPPRSSAAEGARTVETLAQLRALAGVP
jgi:predicted dehydrogenase